MAERKSGPVRPPVIDLTANPAPRPRPADEGLREPAEVAAAPSEPTADAAPETPRPPPPRPLARLAMPWSAITIAAVAGAVLGTALTYAAVNFVALPDNRPIIADPASRLAAQDAAIEDLSARLAAAEAAGKATEASANQAATKASADLDALRQQLAAIPAPVALDLTPLQAQVASLEDRIAAIGAGASGADATALAATIAGLEAGVSELRAALAALTERTSATEAAVTALRGDVDATRTAINAQGALPSASDVGPAVRLPLVVSGIESAFANGRPFSAELSGLTVLLPDLAVPDPIRAASATGLPRPDAVAAAVTEAVPAILAGRTATSSGDLTQDALEWAKGLLALRPVDETAGTTPEAVVSRLEAAMARRDFVGAAALLDQLPEPMQAAAGAGATDIRTLAAADGFIATLRGLALDLPVAETPATAPVEAAP